MNSSQNFILAIAPGKRELGIAVFSGFDLAYVSVKTIKRGKSTESLLEEVTEILQKLFKSFSIKTVITRAISQYQKLSADLDLIVKRIKFESERTGVPVIEITLDEIKAVLGKGEKTTEKKAFETLLASYPQLLKYWNRPNKWQNDYYAFLFSAAASGVVYMRTLSNRD